MYPNAVKVLLVEDEAIVAADLQELLEADGYEVVGVAADASAAMELFHAHAPDLVLMDIQLSGPADGIAVATEMNRHRPVPIMYLTAQADSGSVARARATQPAAYLLKPFEEQALLIALSIAWDNFSRNQPALHPTTLPDAAAAQSAAARERLGVDSILVVQNFYFIKQVNKFIKFNQADLLYIEADNSHTYIYTKYSKFVLRLTLAQVLDKMAEARLVRVHRSYAVRRAAIEAFTDTDITIGGQAIPIGPSYRESFLNGFSVL